MQYFVAENTFRENEYLELYPDVKTGIDRGEFVSGYHHYMLAGQEEKRVFIIGFYEFYYLMCNSDVKTAVNNGDFYSGFHHYINHGEKESRIIEYPTELTEYEVLVMTSIKTLGIPLKIYKLDFF